MNTFENNETIKQGDVLRLRSGGPLMTVRWIFNINHDKPSDSSIPNNMFVKCIWFDEQNHLQEAKFDVRCLTSS